MATHITLYGRVFITGDIVLKTGLHIGATEGPLEIGGVDNPVIRDALTGRPYIPGSSLKGKMRSLAEKLTGAPQNKPIAKVTIHTAKTAEEYHKYWVNPIYGVPAEIDYDIPAPTRLIVRDAYMSEASVEAFKTQAKTDLPFTELKTEVAIDRVTSAASPRTMERVPAGAVFSPFEMVYSVFDLPADIDNFANVLVSMQMLEDDYLGGQGSRGSGKIAFENVSLDLRTGAKYSEIVSAGDPRGVQDWLDISGDIHSWLSGSFG